ncbi:hypothetical protein [Mariniplasma anaerobium]|uniref:Lipoprotein n=1 Tax=Mariniplasma anaerobium TaxID=2735436 RepID=A0A7U9TJD9_9MOLU|nr:hypothetical protein [Mariniplasma anaerobium]BCR35904.1 hypothetical protein MPAN_007970 [Mariniplasma anaerobium]
MKKVTSLIVFIVFMFLLVGCGSLTKDEIMTAHLESGSSINLDSSMYTFSKTVNASFGDIDTSLEVNIISIYLYEYISMDSNSEYAYAYVMVEDKYALKNGASLSVDSSKYIIIYCEENQSTTANEEILTENSISIFNDHRVPSGLEVPTFDLTEIILSSVNLD